MSYGLVTVHGGEDEARIMIEDGDADVTLIMNEEGNLPLHRCQHCQEESDDDEPSTLGCRSTRGMEDCPAQLEDHADCGICAGDEVVWRHDWERLPLTWLNSAGINACPDRDEVTLTISVGDPRGAFAMTVYRVDDGSLRMSVPHPDGLLLHAPLHRLGGGFYHVGYRPEEILEPEPVRPVTSAWRIKIVNFIAKVLKVDVKGE